MTKKEVLRKVWAVIFYLWLFYITLQFLLGKVNIFSMILISVFYIAIALYLISIIIFKIVKIVDSYQLNKTYKNGLEHLKALHKKRYKLYFTGDKEKVEEYSAEIESYGTTLLESGASAISNNLLNQKYSQKLQEILEQTKNLMTSVR